MNQLYIIHDFTSVKYNKEKEKDFLTLVDMLSKMK